MKNEDADLELYKNHKYPERKWKDKQCDKYFTKVVGIALDEPTLGQSTDCLNCYPLIELIKEKTAITECRGDIIQLLTTIHCRSFQYFRVHCKTSF